MNFQVYVSVCVLAHMYTEGSFKRMCVMLGGSPGLVVMGGDSCSEGCGLNPSTVYWMDIFSHLFYVKIVLFV